MTTTTTNSFSWSSNQAKETTTTIQYEMVDGEWKPVRKTVVEREYEKAPVLQPIQPSAPQYPPVVPNPVQPYPGYPQPYTTWRGPQA